MWESVLGCRGSCLKRGVGKVRRDRGVKKYGGGMRKCGKVFWVWEKVKRGVGKCVGVWGSNGGEV